MPKPKTIGMTAKQAYESGIKAVRIDFGDGYFTMIGWKHPETGVISGPFFATVTGDTCIEVDRSGKYLESYPAKADCYLPWVEVQNKKEQ